MKTEKKVKMIFQKANEEIHISEVEKFRTQELLAGQMEGGEDYFAASEISEDQGFCRLKEELGSAAYFCQKIRILSNQIRYMDKRAWAADLVGNICFAVIPVALRYFGAGTEDMVVFLMLSSSLLGSLSILVLSYLFSEEIGELSCTCYFSARQIAAQQMLGLGAVNLLTLGFLICFIGVRWKAELFRIGIYTLVPFVVTVGICMGILQFEGLRNRSYPVTAAGVISGAAFLAIASVPSLYRTSAIIVWGVVFAVGTAVLVLEIRHLFHSIDKGEVLCTDWN